MNIIPEYKTEIELNPKNKLISKIIYTFLAISSIGFILLKNYNYISISISFILLICWLLLSMKK